MGTTTESRLQAGNQAVVSALLARGGGAQIRLPDGAGESPLVLASRNGHAQASSPADTERVLHAASRAVSVSWMPFEN